MKNGMYTRQNADEKWWFHNSCVSWNDSDVHCEGGLIDMIDACESITRATFMRRTDPMERREIEQTLGYGPWLHMRNDWHVSYFRSVLHGERVYGFVHSAIEYVFIKGN